MILTQTQKVSFNELAVKVYIIWGLFRNNW